MMKSWKWLLAIVLLGGLAAVLYTTDILKLDTNVTQEKVDKKWWNELDTTWRSYFINNHGISKQVTEADLEKIAQLEVLDLSNTPIKSFKPVTRLKHIKKLWVQGLEAGDFPSVKPINSLTNLEELSFVDCSVSDISKLTNLKNLKKLELSNSQVMDISVLENYPNIEVLDLSNTQIKNIEALSKLSKLAVLYINNTEIKSLEPIQKAPLTELSCINTKFKDIEALNNMQNLNQLILLNSQVASIKPIYNLATLSMLYCEGAPIPSEQITKFKELHSKCEVF